MQKVFYKMLNHRKLVIILFCVLAAVSMILSTQVKVNYNIVDYLPEQAPSTIAMDKMNEVYEQAIPNIRVMVRDVSVPEALEYKQEIAGVEGVDDIAWLDDQVNIKQPLETLDKDTIKDWYVENNALFQVTIDEEKQKDVLEEIRDIIGEEGAVSGNPVDTVNAQVTSDAEVSKMVGIIIPLIFVILFLTTSSWLEPFLFMTVIGIAIALNLGTNLILGEISFITKTTGMILQLACSMDYAIFLLDSFQEERKRYENPQKAMSVALKKSLKSILSSGLTTIVGFAALCVMQLQIGPDMGIVLAKGIVLSLLATLIFMPCLTLMCYKWIDKTRHRSIMPTFQKFGKRASKIKGLIAAIVFIIIVPCFLGQSKISFNYGVSGMVSPDSKVAEDKNAINDIFGESTIFAIMVPNDKVAVQQEFNDELKNLPEVSQVLSYVETVGKTIPDNFLPKSDVSLLTTADFTRFVVTARLPSESEKTFEFAQKLRDVSETYFEEEYYLAGESANVYDMKLTITDDSVKVNLIAIGAIAVILLIMLKSFSLPIFLLLTIESSVYINIAVPYFTGQTLNYIGYLIITSIQLGATVDYAILFTNRYLDNRKLFHKKTAIPRTISETAGSIFTSGAILTTAGLVLGIVSSNVVISQLGVLIARGAILSVVLVLVFLPALLSIFDKFIGKTTKNSHFSNTRLLEDKERN